MLSTYTTYLLMTWWLLLHWKYDIAAVWSCSGKPGASLLGQDVVASLLSLCMAKWLRKWRRGWLYVRSNTKKRKVSIIKLCLHILWVLKQVHLWLTLPLLHFTLISLIENIWNDSKFLVNRLYHLTLKNMLSFVLWTNAMKAFWYFWFISFH